MNRTITTTRARAWTAAFLASGVIAITSLSTGIARAQDKGGEPAPPPERAQRSEDDSVRHTVVEYKAPRPHMITDWQEGEPIPSGYHPVQRVRKGPIVAGAVTFGVLYFINVLIAAAGTDTANANHTSNLVAGLYVPVVGPFITMTQSSSATADVFLVLDGAGQAAGAVLLLYGLTSPQTVLLRDDAGRPRLLPQPMLFGKSGGGLALTGTF